MNGLTWLLIVAILAALISAAHVGAEQGEEPAFDVVSIRPIKTDSVAGGAFVLPDELLVVGDRLQGRNISVAALILAAYGPEIVARDQVVDGPGWIRSDRFDLDARATIVMTERPMGVLSAAVAQMLRMVLEERFQLRVRRETRPLLRYALIHARTDRALKPGLRPSTLDCTAKVDINGPCEFRPGAGKLVMRGRPIQTFVEFLSRPAYASGRVFDDTGITGNVDIDLEWSMNFGDLPASTASLFTAVQEQLGLKLEPRQIPLPVVVVEQIRRPSEN